MTNTLSHRLAVKMADALNKYTPKEGLAYQKIVLGGEIIFLNASKLFVLFLTSYLLNIVPLTITALIGFNIIRRTAFGLHALTSIGCTLYSLAMFVLFPFLLRDVSVPFLVFIPFFSFIFLSVFFFAPQDTKARPIIGVRTRKRLRVKSIIAALILITAVTLIPYMEIKLMLTLGAFYESVFILPVTYKILGREVKNYEQYEHS